MAGLRVSSVRRWELSFCSELLKSLCAAGFEATTRMSLLTTKSPSRIPPSVASKSEPAAKVFSVLSSGSSAWIFSRFLKNRLNTSASPATNETIADANHRFNAIAALVELLPQTPDVHVERAGVAIITIAPHAIQQLLPRHDSVRTAREHRQKRELLVREFDLCTVTDNANIVEVDGQTIVFVRLAHRLVRAAHHGAHTREQFAY